MVDVLYIPAWDDVFENSVSRQYKKLHWIPVPNKQDGDGYTQLIEDHPNGAAHFGAWNAIVQTASKCSPRGVLIQNDGSPHNSLSLKRKSKIPVSVFDEAIPRLIEIGWLETKQLEYKQVTTEPGDDKLPNDKIYQDTETISQSAAQNETKRTEENGRERTERKSVVAVLLAEGFKDSDPIFDDPHCTQEQAKIAIDNANASQPGKMKDRRGYIVTAIRHGYALSKRAAQNRERAAKAMESQKAKDADAKALADTMALDVIAPRELAKLPIEKRKALAEMVYQKHPSWKSIPGMAERLPMLKAMYKFHLETP